MEQGVATGLKACPRCRGHMRGATDLYGAYIQCLQCGHVVYLENPRKPFVFTPGRLKPGRPRKHGGTPKVA